MKRRLDLAHWLAWAAEGWSVLPYLVQYKGSSRGLPPSWKQAWRSASPYAFVFESGKGGRYTYLGLQPASILQGKGDEGEILTLSTGERQKVAGKPLHLLENWMHAFRAPRIQGWPDFRGGCAGFLSYDVIRSIEQLPALAKDEPGFPDYLWMQMNEIWIYDHKDESIYCSIHVPWDGHKRQEDQSGLSDKSASGKNQASGLSPEQELSLRQRYAEAEAKAERMLTAWNDLFGQPLEAGGEGESENSRQQRKRVERAGELSGPHVEGWDRLEIDFSQDAFQQAVLAIQEYIRQGDVFQVNLSLRRHLKLHGDPAEVYEWMRILNPSPYMGYLTSPGFSLASGSPELLVKVDGDIVSARPIAGTRRRGGNPEEDAAMEAELLGSEKERAEHIMLVDLERNDIGRIAAYGTVHVPELMTVERYSHVMHLVSQVEGRLAEGSKAYDVIAAVFPGGTITGAPKIRTMEIIEELEPVTRGPYTGSMGWIDYNGDMELNIIIRTLAVKDGIGYIQTGAGIVIDSDPYREYRECHNKAKALIAALMCSEEEAAAVAADIGG
ncbi:MULTISPECIES: anthranilate synthase component I family protein [Paenibacillus]|uniref:Anthranilate synthase n=2 Tax=Paenibacillus lactis TaxID=228574 RepID=G4HP40_9BACL|nr:anthranilate synthase component I family protein [Paenibacillus lactis]EHB49672.1 Anthranilate synthase [Paenibacillus lactis 154]MBP1896573.1 para-aminobenzoate synthetase component 1 [Paenibacillus lactis]GIO94561.1 para-aminobenzoate synthase [Paenibacillus lactis]HAF98038.1 anthranilate synthase component I family protein [Paenibacillus lactis]